MISPSPHLLRIAANLTAITSKGIVANQIASGYVTRSRPPSLHTSPLYTCGPILRLVLVVVSVLHVLVVPLLFFVRQYLRSGMIGLKRCDAIVLPPSQMPGVPHPSDIFFKQGYFIVARTTCCTETQLKPPFYIDFHRQNYRRNMYTEHSLVPRMRCEA